HWQKRLGGNYSASPVFANGHVFFCSHAGDISGIRASATATEPVTSHIDGEWKSSPVVLDSQILLRSSTNLFRIQ
ncbi:MAG: PQQ-binding-like beta-propeller repeat protein, partial [Planctomycetaceae bacterium]